jgi:hypothetical protein
MPLDDSILAAVANSNFKSMAELAVQNSLSHQNRLQILAEKALAKSLESMDTTDIMEGMGSAAAQRGDLAKVLAELAGSIASAQQQLKGAQTTPPTTG